MISRMTSLWRRNRFKWNEIPTASLTPHEKPKEGGLVRSNGRRVAVQVIACI